MTAVRRVQATTLGFIVLGSVLAGCASQGGGASSPAKTMSLRVFGAPGTQFTADYRIGGHSQSVTGSLTAKKPWATIAELADDDLECNVRKHDKSRYLTVGIYRADRCLFQAEVPAGAQGVRITRIWAGWKAEPY